MSPGGPGFALWLSASWNERPSGRSPCDQVTVVLEERTGMGWGSPLLCDGRDTCSPSPPLRDPWFHPERVGTACGSFIFCSHGTCCTIFARGAAQTRSEPPAPAGNSEEGGHWRPCECVARSQPGQEGLQGPCLLTAPCHPCILPAEKNHQHKRQSMGATKGLLTENRVKKMWHVYTNNLSNQPWVLSTASKCLFLWSLRGRTAFSPI